MFLRLGAEICGAHRVRWLGRGGEDALSNMVLLCPNHHRTVHGVDAPFDFANGEFLVGSFIEQFAVTHHELVA
ncbi:HNH endonuclease (plasmid) [Azospirillum oryzae]|uniref:HNH endonuclease n=1 Tax=Azospirillum oryzae TaxID=286727 RepID=A0A6N1AEN6_9PROT|nr:HNH endonuclease signature motif containing protein [Azospirillum oryzae]KAA0588799.1 HNH endonuclease [Azospirillum oryzae]QKS50145.1 HNH endonuclease [Azospirillum oryzae]